MIGQRQSFGSKRTDEDCSHVAIAVVSSRGPGLAFSVDLAQCGNSAGKRLPKKSGNVKWIQAHSAATSVRLSVVAKYLCTWRERVCW